MGAKTKEIPKRSVWKTRKEKVTEISRYEVVIQSQQERKGFADFTHYRIEEERVISGYVERESKYMEGIKSRTLPSRAKGHAAKFYKNVVVGTRGNWPTEMNEVYGWRLIGEYLDGKEITRPDEMTCQDLLSSKIPKNLKDLLTS